MVTRWIKPVGTACLPNGYYLTSTPSACPAGVSLSVAHSDLGGCSAGDSHLVQVTYLGQTYRKRLNPAGYPSACIQTCVMPDAKIGFNPQGGTFTTITANLVWRDLALGLWVSSTDIVVSMATSRAATKNVTQVDVRDMAAASIVSQAVTHAIYPSGAASCAAAMNTVATVTLHDDGSVTVV